MESDGVAQSITFCSRFFTKQRYINDIVNSLLQAYNIIGNPNYDTRERLIINELTHCTGLMQLNGGYASKTPLAWVLAKCTNLV